MNDKPEFRKVRRLEPERRLSVEEGKVLEVGQEARLVVDGWRMVTTGDISSVESAGKWVETLLQEDPKCLAEVRGFKANILRYNPNTGQVEPADWSEEVGWSVWVKEGLDGKCKYCGKEFDLADEGAFGCHYCLTDACPECAKEYVIPARNGSYVCPVCGILVK